MYGNCSGFQIPQLKLKGFSLCIGWYQIRARSCRQTAWRPLMQSRKHTQPTIAHSAQEALCTDRTLYKKLSLWPTLSMILPTYCTSGGGSETRSMMRCLCAQTKFWGLQHGAGVVCLMSWLIRKVDLVCCQLECFHRIPAPSTYSLCACVCWDYAAAVCCLNHSP